MMNVFMQSAIACLEIVFPGSQGGKHVNRRIQCGAALTLELLNDLVVITAQEWIGRQFQAD
jgi:hypothetical protein